MNCSTLQRRCRFWPGKVWWSFVLLLFLSGVLWLQSRTSKNKGVVLTFVGYTNVEVMAQLAPSETIESYRVISYSPAITLPKALLLAANTGPTAVEIWAAVRPENLFDKDFVSPSGQGLPKVLNPHEQMIIEIGPGNFENQWWTEIGCVRVGATKRLYDRAWNSGNSNLCRIMDRAGLYPDLVPVRLGPVTNLFSGNR